MITLGENEYVVYTARKHFFIFATEALFVFVFAAIPLFFLPTAESKTVHELFTGVAVLPFLWYLYTLWIIILWLTFVYIWTDYYLDVWVVTNKRVIDVDQHGLFNRKVSDTRLDLIQDITVDIPGIFATFIGYGDILMQTAGKDQEFILKEVAKPNKLKEVILKEIDVTHERARITQ